MVSVPILILNYILGLITIEIGEIIFPKISGRKIQFDFENNFRKVAKFGNELIANRYNEIYQNKRILNGATIGFIVTAIGIFLEGIIFTGVFRTIGFIGLIGSFSVACLCQIISVKIQSKFNKLIPQLDDKN